MGYRGYLKVGCPQIEIKASSFVDFYASYWSWSDETWSDGVCLFLWLI